MSIPVKPAAPYTLSGPLSTGAYNLMLDQDYPYLNAGDEANAPSAVGMSNTVAMYMTKGAVSLVNDAHGLGLYKPGGGVDDYIFLSSQGAAEISRQFHRNIPFTKMFVVKPDTQNLVLFHSDIRDSADYNYSAGSEYIYLAGGALIMDRANQANIFDSSANSPERAPAGQVSCLVISYDGNTVRGAMNGVSLGSAAVTQSFPTFNVMGLGSGANGNTRDGGVFYNYVHWDHAKGDADLVSLSANPYQILGAGAPADVTPPTLTSTKAGNAGFYGAWTDNGAIELTFNEGMSQSSANFNPAVAFSISGSVSGNHVPTGTISVINADAGVFRIKVDTTTAPFVFGETITVAYTQPTDATKGFTDVAGNRLASFSVQATNMVADPGQTEPPPPVTSGDRIYYDGAIKVTVKTIGIGHSYTTVKQFLEAYKNTDLVGTKQRFIGEVYDSHELLGGDYYANSGDDQCYLMVTVADGRGYGANDYTYSTGVELSVSGANSAAIGLGVRFEKLRWNLTTSNALLFKTMGSGQYPRFQYNRVMCNAAGAINLQAYIVADIFDNVFFRNAAVGGKFMENAWRWNMRRNTFVLLAGGTADFAVKNEYGGDYYDNAFYNVQAFSHNSGNMVNNYANVAQTNANSIIVDTVAAFFQNPANDFRAGAALIGKGSLDAESKNDNRGGNRGPDPDAGALQFTVAQSLPTGSVTTQNIDGMALVLEVTTTGSPTAVKVTLEPADTTSGSSTVGPLDMTLSAGKANLTIKDLVGNYKAPIIKLTNAGGTVDATGAAAFSINGAGGGTIYDGGDAGTGGGGTPPVVTLPAPTVVINTLRQNVMQGKTATIAVTANLQSAADGKVEIFRIPMAGGAAVSVGTVSLNNGTGSKQFDLPKGLWKLRAVATANAQTAQADLDNVRVLGLGVGNFTLPV